MTAKIVFSQLPEKIQRQYPDQTRIKSITVSLTEKGEEQYTVTLRNGAKYVWKHRNGSWVRQHK